MQRDKSVRSRATEATIDLRDEPHGATGTQVGQRAPSFQLPDATGTPVALAQRLARGPVVVVFYRGAWCTYCNLHLRALQLSLGAITSRGASLIAISPQAPDDSMTLRERLGLGFDVLSDLDQSVSAAWGLQFELPVQLHEAYRDLDMALDVHNADGTWRLPIPATFVLDGDGIVWARHVDVDYSQRMEPEQVLAALDDISQPTPSG